MCTARVYRLPADELFLCCKSLPGAGMDCQLGCSCWPVSSQCSNWCLAFAACECRGQILPSTGQNRQS
jgi:hypothetical protein